MLITKFSIVFILIYIFSWQSDAELTESIVTTNGPIIGAIRQTHGKGQTYYAYQRIPFAKPPVDDLRFAAPVVPDRWLFPKLAIFDPPRCWQPNSGGKEDCLYINVYSPTNNSNAKLPVMVFVYGGFYSYGDSQYADLGPDYILEENVVFVDFNYRVGIFGFLSTGDEAASGNWGLKDQVLALKWVHENIEAFGGDKDSVTIFGQSAGAGAISYLIQMDQTEGLFHRAILHSGSPLNPWNICRNPKVTTTALATIFGIETKNSTTHEIVAQLRTIETETLGSIALYTDLAQTAIVDPRDGLIFAPVIENDVPGAVVTKKSYENLLAGNFHKIPYIIGFTSEEAGKAQNIAQWIKIYLLLIDIFPRNLIPHDMNLNESDTALLKQVASEIKARYFGDQVTLSSDEAFIRFITDDQFIRGLHESVRLISEFTPVYYYRFSYVGDYVCPIRKNRDAFHGEDLFYLFRVQTDGPVELETENDKNMRNKIVKLWTNFAKYSNPTPSIDPLFNNATWDAVDYQYIYYMNIDQEMEMQNDIAKYNIEFWNILYDKYGNPPYDTY